MSTQSEPNDPIQVSVEVIDIPSPKSETTPKNNNEALIEGLVEMARFLAETPDFPTIGTYLWASIWFTEKAQLIEATRMLRQAKKEYNGNTFAAVRKFGPGNNVQIRLAILREQVCEKKVIGKRKVDAITIEAHEEEVVEWKCSEPLLSSEQPTLVIDKNGQEQIL